MHVELVHECSPERLRMETARMKLEKETEEEGKKRRVEYMLKSTASMKKRHVGLTVTHLPPGSLLPDAVDELVT